MTTRKCLLQWTKKYDFTWIKKRFVKELQHWFSCFLYSYMCRRCKTIRKLLPRTHQRISVKSFELQRWHRNQLRFKSNWREQVRVLIIFRSQKEKRSQTKLFSWICDTVTHIQSVCFLNLDRHFETFGGERNDDTTMIITHRKNTYTKKALCSKKKRNNRVGAV